MAYKVKLMDSERFVASSLLSLLCNIAEGLHKAERKKVKSYLECSVVKENTLPFKTFNKD